MPLDLTMKALCNGVEMQNTWDDGYGPIWVYCESLGPVGVVRALSWLDAYECVIDEIMHDADTDYVTEFEDDELPEGVYFRSGIPSNPNRHTCLAQEDLNHSDLVLLAEFNTNSVFGARIEVFVRCEECAGLHEYTQELPPQCQ